MRPIPPALRKALDAQPFYHRCARRSGACSGRITWEHAFIYGSKQINEEWAIIPLCVYHHLGVGLDKSLNELIALQRASPEDLAKYPRRDWRQHRVYLEQRYKK